MSDDDKMQRANERFLQAENTRLAKLVIRLRKQIERLKRGGTR